MAATGPGNGCVRSATTSSRSGTIEAIENPSRNIQPGHLVTAPLQSLEGHAPAAAGVQHPRGRVNPGSLQDGDRQAGPRLHQG